MYVFPQTRKEIVAVILAAIVILLPMLVLTGY